MKLITRADLDGLTCALLLMEVETIDDVVFAHPKDVQDGKVEITSNDILANLPYDERVGLWFDHHLSQSEYSWNPQMKGAYEVAPSAARVIANHYKSPKFERYEVLLEDTDRLDSATLTMEDVTDPKGWILLGYTLDARTGHGAFKEYFQHAIALAKSKPIDDILADPQVAARIEQMRQDEAAFKAHLLATSRLDANVVITDVRGQTNLPTGNRFLIYTLFPAADVSMRIADGRAGQFVSIQVGHSIFNRTCKTNVGDLMADFGGGGHFGAGTCQPPLDQAEGTIEKILAVLKDNG